jgi:glycerol-3-phosphate dehydrogenase (NAD(P)+)
MKVTILGAGAMGSALTIPLVDNGQSVTLWGSRFDEEILNAIRNNEPHPRIDRELPDELSVLGPDSLEQAVEGADIVVLGVSSEGAVPVTERIAPHLQSNQCLVSIAKGLVEIDDTPYLIQEGIEQVLENANADIPPLLSVGGPSIAAELADRSRTAVACASSNQPALDTVVENFETDYYSLKPTNDVTGLEVCIGYKNAYSIALAWPKGLAETKHINEGMTNFRAILFLQTLEELQSISRALDGDPSTAYKLAGLGDLVTTTAAGRNGSFGRLLGTGESTESALQTMKDQGVGVIEGYETADLGANLLHQDDRAESLTMDDVPLLREINAVLYDSKPVRDAVEEINV